MPAPIEDYALIGDCETSALVGKDGSIDWLCWPRFDSDACFAALLGTRDNGRWRLAPKSGGARTSRRYREGTLILETCFEADEGAAVVIDFMPLRAYAPSRCEHSISDLVRIVRGVRGRVELSMELVLRFGYGRTVPWVTRMANGDLHAVAGPDSVRLHTPAPIHGEDFTTVADLTIAAGQSIPFVLQYSPSYLPMQPPVEAEEALDETERYWRAWSSRCASVGPYSDAVRRSLITLKALSYAPTGAIVAAPTTSLPEEIGGSRNWDYRFCWLRDATLTLLALMNAGYYGEAAEFRQWLLRAVAGNPDDLQIMYGIAGERRLDERELPWLPGYEGSCPVRIGNGAHGQLQLDVFGEVMDALHHARRGGLAGNDAAWALQRALLDHLEKVWTKPDDGIWESRGGPQHFTHSKVMAWTAFDRAIRSAEDLGLESPLDAWRELRARIHHDVCERGFDAELGSFVQAYGTKHLDASLLLMPSVGFLPPEDPRVRGTLRAVEQRLVRDGFVLRYDTAESDDGLPPGEGAFLACSFWLADAWIAQGREAEARALFERLLSIRNDVGLLAEEYDPRLGRQVGNFPQAFSHVALVDTALNLASAKKPIEQRLAASAA